MSDEAAPDLAALALEVLRLARAEGALEGDGLASFARALAERAELVLAERAARTERELREVIADLERQASGLREEHARASAAHDSLLAHHRDVLGQVIKELVEVAALPIYRRGEGRRRLEHLLAVLRAEAK